MAITTKVLPPWPHSLKGVTGAKHAFLSPSGAPAWLRCHAKVWREKDLPNESSDFANEGTAAHYLMEMSIASGSAPMSFEGQVIGVADTGACWNDGPNKLAYRITVDRGMSQHIAKTLDWVFAYKAEQMYSEKSLCIQHITGEQDATGTVDITQLRGAEICVTDLKYGMGVQVYAEDNEQLLMYADAAVEEFDLLGEIETVRMRIAQPRLDHFDEWVITLAELQRRVDKIRKTAKHVMTIGKIAQGVPGDKQCKFCRAKATCAQYRDHTLGTVMFEPVVDLKKGEIAIGMIEAEKLIAQAYGVTVKSVTHEGSNFIVKKPSIVPQVEAAVERIATENDEQLATVMDAADMIEGFVKAVRAEVERRLLDGQFTDARYKLVEGKKGARKWIDEEEAEKVMKAMRLKVDQMYDLKVISPTSAEKVLAVANPRKWTKLQDQITQGSGKPSVAPASDKRPALNMTVQFEALPDEGFDIDQFIEEIDRKPETEVALLGLSVEDDLI